MEKRSDGFNFFGRKRVVFLLSGWLQRELLAQGYVDAVLNGAPRSGTGNYLLFSFTVARTPDEIVAHAETRYHPVEMSGVIRHMIDNPGRYAAIGTPCFAKALRLAARQSPELQERLRFVLGIVCGHLKPAPFARALAAQCGIARALYHDADLIVFDEATSALDNLTEREVMASIEALPGGMTILMIAHRLSTVKVCDRIVVRCRRLEFGKTSSQRKLPFGHWWEQHEE